MPNVTVIGVYDPAKWLYALRVTCMACGKQAKSRTYEGKAYPWGDLEDGGWLVAEPTETDEHLLCATQNANAYAIYPACRKAVLGKLPTEPTVLGVWLVVGTQRLRELLGEKEE